MNPVLRKVIILGSPLVLGTLDIFHPTGFGQRGILQAIAPVVNWWLLLHILQLPLFCLLALAAYLLLDGVQSLMATISRIAISVFVIFYPAFDGLIGIGTGSLIRYATMLPLNQRILISSTIDTFWRSPLAYLLAAVGSVGWAIALLTAAIALSKPTWSSFPVIALAVLSIVVSALGQTLGLFSPVWLAAIMATSVAFGFAVRPHLPAGLLLMASFLFSATHAPPFGPAGLACFFLAVVQLELSRRKAEAREPAVSPTI
jgi:hypothetical protein